MRPQSACHRHVLHTFTKSVRAKDHRGVDLIIGVCTTKRFPSPRCAFATKIVRPLQSIAATQPQLQPAFAEIDGDDFPPLFK
jgi:hypothetical protein